ncbi:MAG: hypothetical protein SGPRY_001694 [Prymnesium sp.]
MGDSPEAAAATITCFCELIGPPLYLSDGAAAAARGTAARHAALARGDSLPQCVARRRRRGGMRIAGVCDEGQADADVVLQAMEGGAAGDPYAVDWPEDASTAFACLLACPSVDASAIQEVAELRSVRVRRAQAHVCAAHQPRGALVEAVRGLRNERNLVILCPCQRHGAEAEGCHATLVAAHLEQQADVAEEAEIGPPPAPVVLPPAPALGLNLEAAKPYKWHLGGEAIWIRVGLSATWLVTWVPRHKAALLLATIARVLVVGESPVAEHRSFVGAQAVLTKRLEEDSIA